MALARDGIEHHILAPDAVSRFIIEKQIGEFNKRFVYPDSGHTVASVDTLIARAESLGNWVRQVALVQIDEGHHALAENKWGRSLNIFPAALRIGWTGTAMRPDRRSLRRGMRLDGVTPLGGVYDALVLGPTPRELLDAGYLAPYRIYGPPPSIDTGGLAVGGSGDYAGAELRKRAHKSTVTGDMVAHYLKLTPGKVAIAFLVDVEQAKETAERFNAAGVPAAWMSSRETDDRTRVRTMEALRRGELHVLCNVDLLGEGVDVPRVEVVLDGRPTMSLVRYLQVFGRLLRTYPGKVEGYYIDLVGNVIRHGLPDAPREWSLDAPERVKRTENDETALKACPECFQVFERFRPQCPHCGFKPVPAGRSRPEEVDGDLTEYSPELLARLRGEADKIMGACPPGVAPYVVHNWNARAVTQQQLREAIDMWAGVQRQRGRDDAESYRLFWHRFGTDVLTAQTLGRTQAAELHARVWGDINNECTRPKGPVDRIEPDYDEVNRIRRLSKYDVSLQPTKNGGFTTSFRENSKQYSYFWNKSEKGKANDAIEWLNCNRGNRRFLPDDLKSIGNLASLRLTRHGNYVFKKRIAGKEVTYYWHKTEQDKAEIAVNWLNSNKNMTLPDALKATDGRKLGNATKVRMQRHETR